MAKLNVPRKKEPVYTHGGALTTRASDKENLRRAVMACLLWEDQFYESGVSIAERIQQLVPKVKPELVVEMAIEARERMNLRHVPLLLVREMARINSHKAYVKDCLARIIQRPDELTEFLAIYWKDGKQPLAASVKKGLAKAFGKFNEYQLAKYNSSGGIKLRDVLFLCHPNPKDHEQDALWKRLIEDKLKTPDTWEVNLSAGKDKKLTFERLMQEGKLGAMALLRNLRNMAMTKVNPLLIEEALVKADYRRVLPFRFLSAAKAVPEYEHLLEAPFIKCVQGKEKLPGKTILIIDVSGSMYGSLISKRSEMNRAYVACALAVLVREQCEQSAIYATAGNDGTRVHATARVPSRKGFALIDAIYNMCRPLGGGGIFLKQVMDFVFEKEQEADRIIVITDEQDCDANGREGAPARSRAFGKHNYIINVASYDRGIAYSKWTHITGWSDAALDYILEIEKVNKEGKNAVQN